VVFDPDPIKADWMVADLPWVFFEVSERSERAMWKTRAMKCAKWLQT